MLQDGIQVGKVGVAGLERLPAGGQHRVLIQVILLQPPARRVQLVPGRLPEADTQLREHLLGELVVSLVPLHALLRLFDGHNAVADPGHGLLVVVLQAEVFEVFRPAPALAIQVQVDAVAHKDQHDFLRQAQILDPLAHDVRIGRAERPVGDHLLQPGVEILIAVDLLVHAVALVHHGGDRVDIAVGRRLVLQPLHQAAPLPVDIGGAHGFRLHAQCLRLFERHVGHRVIALHQAVQVHAHIVARRLRQKGLNKQILHRSHPHHRVALGKAAKGHSDSPYRLFHKNIIPHSGADGKAPGRARSQLLPPNRTRP